ncbi:MAG: hypothetical protein EOP59_16955 [Sphingomonadales bacterium]|nr:MAG: hypothetical protein EOP59_16955 [Sphingomonadales bacterium]
MRRLLLPAALSGVAAHALILSMIGGAPILAFHLPAVTMLALIALTGYLAAGLPLFAILRRRRCRGILASASVLLVGTVAGGILVMLFFKARAVPDIAMGLAVGALASLIWLAINFDLVRAPAGDTSG